MADYRRHRRIKPFLNETKDMSRAEFYNKAALIPGLIVKDGRTAFVDLDVYEREVVARRKPAIIKPPKAERKSETSPNAAA